jgi:hypothetical protein
MAKGGRADGFDAPAMNEYDTYVRITTPLAIVDGANGAVNLPG